jgi:hypothetical protein
MAALGSIPRIFHQTWKTSAVPPVFAPFQQSWLAHNPDWEYRFWTDESARRFVAEHYPWFLPTYDGYARPIARVDAVRYMWMHRIGGVYVDLDFECLRPIDSILAGRSLVLGEEPAAHGMLDTAVGRRAIACNAFIASAPGHPFWLHLLERLVEHRHAASPLDATGPYLLTRVIAEYPYPEQLTIAEADVLYGASKSQAWGAAAGAGVLVHPPGAVAVHHWYGTWWRKGALARSDDPDTRGRAASDAPRVLIATPVKNARPHLPRYVENLRNLTYPHDRISIAFLESDSDDGSHDYLASRVGPLRGEFRRVSLTKHDVGYRFRGPRSAVPIQRTRRSVIAKARNRLLQAALCDEEWVLWIDADVVEYPRDIIETLLDTRRSIVVPHCVRPDGRTFDLNTFQLESGAAERDWSRHIVDGIVQPPRGEGRLYLEQLTDHPIVPVDGVGGTMLLVQADLHRDGLIFPSYSHRLYIETEGLAMMARDMGVQCWGLPNVRIVHA